MKRKTRIIQISGIRGLLMIAFIGICLAAGFIVFPGYLAMHIWNYIASYNFVGNSLPFISIYQGIMLWSIFAIACYMVNDKKKYLVALKNSSELTEEELKKLMDRIKIQAQSANSAVLKSSEIKTFEEKEKTNNSTEVKQEEVKK